MTIEDFLSKWQLVTEHIDLIELINFISTLDYLYCSMTKEQLLELVSDYYENADDIYNSILLKTTNSEYKS